MVTPAQVLLASTVGLVAAGLSYTAFHAVRAWVLDGFDRLMEGIDDALSVDLPDYLLDDED